MLLTVERMLPLASLALVGCATAPPPVLSAADWRVEPPAAACEARSERKQGVMLRRYDAEGRLLFATTMPFTDMHGAEWFTWRGNKLVAVDSYLEGAGGRLFCGRGDSGAEGRWIERSDLRWQGAQLVEITQSLRAYQRDDSCDNVWRLHDHREHSSSYEYRGPWLKAQGSYIRYDFEGDRPVRRHRKMGLIFGGELVDRWIWKGDRVTTYLWNDYTERFEYDAQGRLIAEWVDDPRDQSRTNRFWAYDGTAPSSAPPASRPGPRAARRQELRISIRRGRARSWRAAGRAAGPRRNISEAAPRSSRQSRRRTSSRS